MTGDLRTWHLSGADAQSLGSIHNAAIFMKTNLQLWMLPVPLVMLATATVRADEQFLGFTRGAETLPLGRTLLYQFMTLRTGKAEGSYYGSDFQTELQHGFTDKFQASLSIVNHYLDNYGVNGVRDALPDHNDFHFGGITAAAKYRVWSTFEDPLGLAFRLESGYLFHDAASGLSEHEFYVAPEVDLQKDFRDDTVIFALNLGPQFAWAQEPDTQDRELALQSAAGMVYRFAPNWYVGAETTVRAEYPDFDLNNFEHVVVYAGPSLHYSSKRWWVTLTWVYQVWGNGVGEPADGRTYAEDTDHQIRLKVGFNF
jgi:Family of unknown function (DUF6662)